MTEDTQETMLMFMLLAGVVAILLVIASVLFSEPDPDKLREIREKRCLTLEDNICCREGHEELHNGQAIFICDKFMKI